MRFAVFVMTYHRPEILGKTIVSLLGQSIQPEKILIIDNDPSFSAKVVAEKLTAFPIAYHATGDNIGPAGAAAIGLKILSDEGYDWIGWMDDDDPPVFSDSFEKLLTLAQQHPDCGCVGAVGHYFNVKTGLINRVADHELEGEGSIAVDNIAGGMCKIVSGNVFRKHHILPNKKLFYGFEELEFDLQMKNAGYSLLTDKELYKRNRLNANRLGYKLKRGLKKQESSLWREYYSTRNMLYILRQHGSRKAVTSLIVRSLLKSFLGFRFGFKYGITNTRFILKALFHFLKGTTGSIYLGQTKTSTKV